ncbi:hypothetical protein [Pseudogulbenkiania ferrooxidans]|uniref:Uncharacterized protein n=1 Tax=Pseudogulbenkiania ferrooxidans 2002 TaxID=279714 RepID=B9Z3Q0_9NEIS|nr:hypothetical protein [Pseudogulbenkiania ferrooxidans]EEG08477.1 hypothetical protein FuraDRAFT_1985 [Pseudogulbenkiania ferrooxidans 2002]
MKSQGKQGGWYTGLLMISIIMVVVLFVSAPWIPLALLAALAVVGVIQGISWLFDNWKHRHDHTHAH